MLVILGPTASGKTAFAVSLAYEFGGEVISADSRQVYRGMDIGTGKDLDEYLVNETRIPCHLVDIADPGYEYNIFEYQRDFLTAYHGILDRKKLPVLCGGSGMYLEAVLKGYRLADAPEDEAYMATLEGKTETELAGLLRSLKTLHNTTDLEDRPRLVKALLVARHTAIAASGQGAGSFPRIPSVILGISYPRDLLMDRIARRLNDRLENGMVEEVERLLNNGLSAERLMRYGLEYRFVTMFLEGKLSREALFTRLNIAIRQFAKRQMTWFRRMERQGTTINWIDGRLSPEEKLAATRTILDQEKR